MNDMQKLFNCLLMFLTLALFSQVSVAQVYKTDEIEVEVIAETTNVVPGETLWLAIRLTPIENWHTYWKFGGDSGEATAASQWVLPEGAVAGDILWPRPEWTPFEGTNLVTFTYEREVFLPLPITVPADLSATEFNLSTKIDWQVCDVICIPGDAVFNLSLPVADTANIDTRWQAAFAETRASLPEADHGLQAQFSTHDDKFNVMITAAENSFADVAEAYFFTEQGRVMKYAPYRQDLIEPGRIQISFEQHRRMPADLNQLQGLLSVADAAGNWRTFEIDASRSNAAWSNSIEVELLAETTNVVPGQTLWLAARLAAAEGWHTYWKTGGDSGGATEMLDWQAPAGTSIGEIQWPVPSWLPFPGTDLVNYGYEGEVVLPFSVSIPDDLETNTVELSTTLKWYVCEMICIPGQQRLELSLPVSDVLELDAGQVATFAAVRNQLPQTDHNLQMVIAAAGERVSLGFQAQGAEFADVSDAWFFPEQRRVIANGPLREVSLQPSLVQITHQQPARMVEDLGQVFGTLVLATDAGDRRAYDFVNPATVANNQTTVVPLASAIAGAGDGGSPAEPISAITLLGFMLAAMVGGLILNLMPCVFPVLSLKALTLAANAGAAATRQRIDGLIYTAGVIVSFLLLASVLMLLRASGEYLGWGFQLQQPWFVALIIGLFFLLGLSLSGVFEIGSGLMSTGSSLTEHSHGYRRSFFTGVLATIVATPCTAPFMGPALGFALTQSWIISMLVFAMLGLGMALPILLLSFAPLLSSYLPKPGSWMVTFKEFMAFPLYLTALYFLWVLGAQVGSLGMALVLGLCLLMAFTIWLSKHLRRSGLVTQFARAGLATACLVIAVLILRSPFMQPAASTLVSSPEADSATLTEDGFIPFSAQRVAELRSAGTPVFVNMTAAWCITCLANEQTTLGTERVKQAMDEFGVVYMKGDWTNEDPEITQVLNQFNRPSVPLYILYPGNLDNEPTLLPQLLTPDRVIQAFADL